MSDPQYDCATCGACCRAAYDSVPVTDEDAARLAGYPELIRVHDDGWRDLHRTGENCVALRGDGTAEPFRCIIYELRPTNCRDLEPGSPGCRTARQRLGIEEGRS